jgi:hypothetical protein
VDGGGEMIKSWKKTFTSSTQINRVKDELSIIRISINPFEKEN